MIGPALQGVGLLAAAFIVAVGACALYTNRGRLMPHLPPATNDEPTTERNCP